MGLEIIVNFPAAPIVNVTVWAGSDTAFQQQVLTSLTQLGERMSAVEDAVQSLTTAVTNVTQVVAEDVELLQQSIEEQNGVITQLRELVESQSGQLGANATQITDLLGQIETLQTDQSTALSGIASNVDRLNQIDPDPSNPTPVPPPVDEEPTDPPVDPPTDPIDED